MVSSLNPARTRRLCAAAMAAALLAGCAGSPLVRWTPPAATGAEGAGGMEHARAYAAAARSAYQDAIARQVNASGDLSNMLLGTGALIVALAAGQVHRDAILGASMIAGSTYAFGQLNFDRRRLLVYQAGVEAINCANRAVAPFVMSTTDAAALAAAIAQVEAARGGVDAASTDLRHKLGALPAAATLAADARATIAAADLMSASSAEALLAAQRFASAVRRAGNELMLAVDRIDAAVVRATLDTLPDLSAVPSIVAGLAGMAGSFAPGTGAGQALTDRLKSSLGGAKSAAGAPLQPTPAELALMAAIVRLEQATATLGSASLTLQSRMAGREGALAPDAFKDCGVTNVAFPLALSTETLQFKLATESTRSVLVSGGTKPYVIDVEGAAVEGLTVKGPAPFESRVVVSVTAGVKSPAEQSILVMDSSSPTRSRSIVVKVGGTPDPAPGGAGSAPPSVTAVAGPTQVAARLNGLTFQRDAVTYTVSDTKAGAPDPSSIAFTLGCSPKPAAAKRLKRAALKTEILNKLDVKDEATLGANLVLSVDAGCALD